jgi:hypothetical protein
MTPLISSEIIKDSSGVIPLTSSILSKEQEG